MYTLENVNVLWQKGNKWPEGNLQLHVGYIITQEILLQYIY